MVFKAEITLLAGNNYPDFPHSQGGRKFATQISPLLKLLIWTNQKYQNLFKSACCMWQKWYAELINVLTELRRYMLCISLIFFSNKLTVKPESCKLFATLWPDHSVVDPAQASSKQLDKRTSWWVHPDNLLSKLKPFK